MLVVLGPEFDGSPESYARLSKATGLVAYDLRSRVKPGSWGVVKALGDTAAAAELAHQLREAGFSPLVLDQNLAHEAERKAVQVTGIDFHDDVMVLKLRDRDMPVPYGGLCAIVEGEIQVGRHQTVGSTPSSTSFRAPTSADLAAFRDTSAHAPSEAFLAADLHFATVLWFARIDSRHFDYGPDRSGVVAMDLDFLLKRIAQRAPGVRIDRAVKTSSLASFGQQKVHTGGSWPPPSSKVKQDERFDPYSRFVGECERQLRLGSGA